MSGFLYGVALQWKLDLRSKEVLMVYYIVPLVFFVFMGGIFTSIDPMAKDSLIQSMTIFGVTMGAYLGAPTPLIEAYSSEIKKAYKVGGIPLWATAVNNFISAFIHIFIMSIAILLIAPIAFNAKTPENLLIYFISLSMFIITCLAVGTVLGVLVKKESKLMMISQLIFLPSIMLSGIMFPAEMLPEVLQGAGKIFPATWAYEMMQQSSMEIVTIIPLLIITAVTIFISIWRISNLHLD